MALPVVLDCHSSLLVDDGSGSSGGGGRGCVNGSVVLGRLFAHLPSLIADVNVAKLKNVRAKPNLLETDKVRADTQSAQERKVERRQCAGFAAGDVSLTPVALVWLNAPLMCQILFTYQFRETHSKYHVMVSQTSTRDVTRSPIMPSDLHIAAHRTSSVLLLC